MEVYVEHHNWRKLRSKKSKRNWTDNTVIKFKKLSSFEKYIIETNDKYPEHDVTYNVYECLGGPKGKLIAKLHYKNKRFNLECFSNIWKSFCHNL